ncbi:FliH/SctL family protein [Sphingomonas nostoxanthinifaciens]|uniref:FliH/SctL family protein n=1 Tax=Sphingomonas nostoxanthinifaciens TaxID=2872652 RepID=UPI001CC1C2E2|nr:hypothetical protein [Sphingomonas nostoxanthinifaciens]UAK26032.1 hypothetical protein K8P63_07955 [Sphingomonas nostoxanthinifaciens]
MFEPNHEAFSTAERVPAWTRPSERRFTAAPASTIGGFSAWTSPRGPEPEPAPVEEIVPVAEAETLIAQGFAQGLEEGRRIAEAELDEDRRALAHLAQSLDVLQPEPPAALAALLAETVRRLVAQVVGEVEICAATLEARTTAIAALIVEETGPSRLRLNPDDAAQLAGAQLDVAIIADPALARGAILLETGAGWVEDGPAVRLDKLRTALDRMGAPR